MTDKTANVFWWLVFYPSCSRVHSLLFYRQESETEEHEETEEEFLDRYAKAAVALETGTVIEEGDEEDQEHETELGKP